MEFLKNVLSYCEVYRVCVDAGVHSHLKAQVKRKKISFVLSMLYLPSLPQSLLITMTFVIFITLYLFIVLLPLCIPT